MRIQFLLLLCLALLYSCKEGPTTTVSGFPYTMHYDAAGPTPVAGEYAYFEVDMLANDSLLNSSDGMPELPRLRIPEDSEINSVAPLIEGLKLMSVGDSMTLHFPLDSMEMVPPAFSAFEEIVYNLKLVEIKSEAAFQTEMQEAARERDIKIAEVRAREAEVGEFAQGVLADKKANKLDLQKSETGISYVIHEMGTGKKPSPGNMTSVHYYGLLENGLMFDNSFRVGEPYTFPIGQLQVIRGWDEGLQEFPEGTRASIFIPAEMGYGASGYQDIPGNAELYFYVEMANVN